MRKTINVMLMVGVLLIGLNSSVMAAMNDAKGSKDHDLFTRMPNFKIYQYREMEFDTHKFRVQSAGKETSQSVEGRLYYIKYVFDKSTEATSPSKLQILRNYQNAAAKVGGTTVFENPNLTTLKISKDNKEIWVEVASVATGTEYALYIVEQQAMKQDVVANAEALKAGLAASGHVELQGIYFDTGKADIKPESEAALKEVAKMLQQSGEIKVWVVGHTDYVGTAESNLSLSTARAASVVKYLTDNLAIDAKRLGSFGAGPYAPIAPNNTEEGRSKNRRVELVVQP
jgi:outer membrane protein OmpA-like peptidoglycan-associated protein